VPIKEKAAPAKRAVSSSALEEIVLPQTYTVAAGDTLSHLAMRFYGLSTKWPQIQQANPDTLKNPHYLYIGQQLLIPSDAKSGG
jgi:nucleoid-associated protein YgaU